MFKIFPPLFLVVPVAWLTLLILSGIGAATPLLTTWGLTPQKSWAVLAVQLILALIFLTPAWRLAWRVCPRLNSWIYPDLNGLWEVNLETNWPRIDALVEAASHRRVALDMRNGDENDLPPMGHLTMRARITQSWTSMKMELWNPSGKGPIRESNTLLLQPSRAADGRHELAYVFEQENATDVLSDDAKFRGAAVLKCASGNPQVLTGRMWNDRMWRRGMNTAADLRFTRPQKSMPDTQAAPGD